MGLGVECCIKGCPKEARWHIGFRVWPAGRNVMNRAAAVEGVSGKFVCDEHVVRDPDKFWTPGLKERMQLAFLQNGRGMPDFTNAEIIHTEISEGEPITMVEAGRLGGSLDAA
jgi:hypothetical protein